MIISLIPMHLRLKVIKPIIPDFEIKGLSTMKLGKVKLKLKRWTYLNRKARRRLLIEKYSHAAPDMPLKGA